MSLKELNHTEDALDHKRSLMNQCQEAIQDLQDPALKNQVQRIRQRCRQISDSSYNLA